ncbi:hypothetical protein TIFTF001_028478 [Ficus carica]|uniref:Uncharacterized protein n=1 Tax=Ficus carica TaxID=3494 RepID=A0AA88J1T2_FICCA|nr:hypothetical protein TIFTF001_028478 [Ficus carica]
MVARHVIICGFIVVLAERKFTTYVYAVAIKGQALADFVAEFGPRLYEKSTKETKEKAQVWKLYIDRSSNKDGSGTGIILVPRAENSNADALAHLATSKDSELLKIVLVEVLERPTIQ